MESLLEFFESEFYYNNIGNWAISLVFIFGAILIARLFYWFLNKVAESYTERTSSRIDDLLLRASKEPAVFIVAILASWYGLERLTFTSGIDDMIGSVYYFIISIGFTWLLVRLVDAFIEQYLLPLAERTESDFDDQLLPIVRKGASTVLWILGVIVALNNAGYNVSAIIAGMGIGGLAFAMAAKDSISNIFGGFTIFTDKPFKINDRIKISGFDGTVVEIGIRSTRLKTLEGRIVTIPNSKFTDGLVENVSVEPSRKVVMNLGLTYNTTPDKMEEAMNILSQIHVSMPALEEQSNVAFTDFGDFSLGITFIYYIKKGADIFSVKSAMNLNILKEFNNANIEMAFPTQTIYTQKGE
jgi:MscS family membrane protein